MAKLEIEILDINWPKITMVGKATDANGGVTVVNERVPFDQAYTQFEGKLHNLLRPLVETTIQKRKRT